MRIQLEIVHVAERRVKLNADVKLDGSCCYIDSCGADLMRKSGVEINASQKGLKSQKRESN